MSEVCDLETNGNPYQNIGMSLALVKGYQSMSLNAHKLLRLAIMQNRYTKGGELKEYRITVAELIRILEVEGSKIYKEADKITTEIMQQVVKIGDPNHGEKSWLKFNWVNTCRYDDENKEIRIKLHDHLKPYLLALSKDYLHYEYSEMIHMKSVYGIRLYELIRGQAGYERKQLNTQSFFIEMSVSAIRMACGLGNKYKQLGEFKKWVLDTAIEQINANSNWRITGYENGKKRGRTIQTIIFEVVLNTEFQMSKLGRERYKQYMEWKVSNGFNSISDENEAPPLMEGQSSLFDE